MMGARRPTAHAVAALLWVVHATVLVHAHPSTSILDGLRHLDDAVDYLTVAAATVRAERHLSPLPPSPPADFSARCFVNITQGISKVPPHIRPSWLPFTFSSARGAEFGLEVEFFEYLSAVFTIVQTPNTTLMKVNGQCRHQNATFKPWFSWLPYASYAGSAIIDGVTCHLWSIGSIDKPPFLKYAAAVDTNGPKQFQVMAPQRGALTVSTFTFRNVTEGSSPLNMTCSPPFFCTPQSPVMQTLPMVRLHSRTDYSLENENTGDLVGDTMWICLNLEAGKNASDQLMSLFHVETNTTYGQYQLCNDKNCAGALGQPPNVGHEGFAGLDPAKGGQCSSNPIMGNWYSLNSEAKAEGQWRLIKRVRSVSVDCLLDQGLHRACQASRYPFENAQMVVQKALGGACPDIPPPSLGMQVPSK